MSNRVSEIDFDTKCINALVVVRFWSDVSLLKLALMVRLRESSHSRCRFSAASWLSQKLETV